MLFRSKGPGPDDTPKRPDHRPPKVQPAPDGAGNLSGQDTGAQGNGFAPFFAAQKWNKSEGGAYQMSELKRTQLYDVHVAAGSPNQ